MDIGSGNGYPAGTLSNFAPHGFVVDGIECASMEGFLQSLKFSSQEMQIEVCKLIGKAAKSKGSSKNWRQKQTLYWKGKAYKRDSEEYQKLLDKAYKQLAKNEGFKKALLATGNATLTHSLGKKKKSETVLTTKEFTSRLTRLREQIKKVNKDD